MTGSIESVVIAALVFVGAHMLLSWQGVRAPLAARIGEWPFRGLYSVVAIAALVWLAAAYAAAPRVEIWADPAWGRVVLSAVMLLATLFVVVGFSPASPTGVEGRRHRDDPSAGRGIFAVTRHPMMWGIALWAIGHLIVNGDLASIILFGGLAALALTGMAHMDRRGAAADAESWQRFAASTSLVPFAALLTGRTNWGAARIPWWRLVLAVVVYGALIAAHEPIIGV